MSALVHSYRYVADNSVGIPRGEPGHDWAYKIRPMIRSLVAAWQAAYSIEKAVSIDECTISFKEHVFMLQYMKQPNKLGINELIIKLINCITFKVNYNM